MPEISTEEAIGRAVGLLLHSAKIFSEEGVPISVASIDEFAREALADAEYIRPQIQDFYRGLTSAFNAGCDVDWRT